MEHYPNETMPIQKEMQDRYLGHERFTVYWTEPGLKITRLRLVTDPGFPAWDVSYCWGELKDGTPVHVALPFFQLPKRGLVREIIAFAKKDKVYAKGLGILDCISRLW